MTSLCNIDYLKHLCQKYGLVPSKKYGQNFLINPEPIAKIMEAAEIKPDDVVVEVGPGFGVLTLALAEKAKKVAAFEIEKKLEPYWEEVFRCHPELVSGSIVGNSRQMLKQVQHDKIEIVWGNILKYPISNIQYPKYKVIANLPYQITSNVIRKFLEMEHKPDSAKASTGKPELMVLMVQKEVAERICAKPGDMSVLAVSVQCYAEPEIIAQVPRSYFWPVPGVDSAVIKLRLKKSVCHSDRASQRVEESLSSGVKGSLGYARDDNWCDDKQFFKIVKAGFANRRKMLIKNLSSVADKKKLPTIFKELGISEKARAQELSVEQWRQLVKNIT